jgi:hypothetical protein
MGWVKQANIFYPPNFKEWAGSHAQVPTVLLLEDRVRIFYADRTKQGKSFITYFDLNRGDLSEIIYFHKRPVMQYGNPGAFDDEGMMPSCLVEHDGRLLLYYTGWNQGVTIAYRNSVGVACSEDNGNTFTRMFEGPIVDRSALEPYMAVTPFVMRDGEQLRMWYTSGTSWIDIDGKFEPVYVIKYATSQDAFNWIRPNLLCVKPNNDEEAFCRPSVLKLENEYRMWFCSRGSRDYRDGKNAYRIGFARSPDGLTWTRDDAFGGLNVSDEPWQSTMTCYPYGATFDGATHMFYNGNSFGQSGIGHAIWQE